MVKYTRLDLKPNHVLVKVAVSMLLMGLALHLLYSTSTTDSSVGVVVSTEVPFIKEILEQEKDDSLEIHENPHQNQVLNQGKCDLFVGEWIPDPLGPIYTNETCNVITDDQNCMSNGRPDSGYLYWRWKPRDCELPRFNAAKFLDSMRDKHWGFVGDSISRNHVQSLLCILSKVEAANDVYHDEVYRDRRWHFPSYNFSLSVIWSPFLVKAYSSQGFSGGASDDIQLHLDKLDNKWTDQYESFDYMVMSGGKWFQKTAIYYENNSIVGCHNCTLKKMVKYTRLDEKPKWFILKQYNNSIVKVTVSILVIGFALCLLYSATTTTTTSDGGNSIGDVSITETPPIQGDGPDEKCDLAIGEWIPDPLGPMYTNESCNVITDNQNCMMNGRPDTGYLYWRWKPRDCELPRFDAVRFLDSMRNKHWAFIGDSISRNHVQSVLCILSKVEAANEVYHDKDFRNRRWHFPTYNFSLTIVWSPFLVRAYNYEGVKADAQIHLDELDSVWADQYKNFDYVVMSGGKWFLRSATYHENNTIVGCHYCPGKNLTEYGLDNGYRKAIKLVIDFVLNSNHNASVLYRATTSDHFENGSWDTGGSCDRTVPFREGEISLNDLDVMFRDIELEAFKDLNKVEHTGKRKFLKLLDVTKLSLLRPDGHPGPYRYFQPFAKDKNATVQYDCLHWCLPGPIDSWNDLVMEMVMNG
ncbi:hypothetical protein MKW94_022179 [Papaver nudicaule]|uniref:Trichome birefringence-like N-terminal domain-containing protein n=1 Tax=Papaver nudicaule TaxID=74823 RepID=A0AA41SG35_PAPNU|nr:hypothetical protein [Papaver nudicaule]